MKRVKGFINLDCAGNKKATPQVASNINYY